MVVLSPLLTLLAIVVIGILVFATKKSVENSGKYFVGIPFADVTGFVEEHMNGQRAGKCSTMSRNPKRRYSTQLNEFTV